MKGNIKMDISNRHRPSCDSLVYLNKVFFDDKENASPILTALSTSDSNFTQQFTIDNSGSCCCCEQELSDCTRFDICSTKVFTRSYRLNQSTPLTPNNVTVEGLPITAIATSGNQFIGDISGIMSEITKCPCQSTNCQRCPGKFVMFTAAGPWALEITIVVEGTMFNNAAACPFKVCFTTIDNTPLTITGGATFAFCNVDIPCQVNGISPALVIDFDACVKLLNPTLQVTSINGCFRANLTGSLVVTPQASLQVTRKSLFNLNACEVEIPCDDVGQCDPCNEAEATCIDEKSGCCCDEEEHPKPKPRNDCAGQCCSTNIYSF